MLEEILFVSLIIRNHNRKEFRNIANIVLILKLLQLTFVIKILRHLREK